MDEKRIEGIVEHAAGAVQDTVGGLIGDSGTQAKGKLRQAAGTLKNAYGTAVDEARDISDTVGQTVEKRPLAALLTVGAVGFFIGWMAGRR
jgi:uncharacterized protein YjbJ (UPF0337 family)